MHTGERTEVLIIGAGDIGEAVCRRLEPFGVNLVRVARRRRDGVYPVTDLPWLLPLVRTAPAGSLRRLRQLGVETDPGEAQEVQQGIRVVRPHRSA